MSFNVAEGIQLPINTFGGLNTEVPPSNVPENGSPDNQDVQYWPGAVGSRDGLQKQFTNPLTSGTLTYAKSYVDSLGVIRNLYLASDGSLFVENVTATPGTVTLLTTTTPGSYAKSITAFGREYIAISDGLHGTDIPFQYDGTNLDRVTQDGPGGPPTISNLRLPEVAATGLFTIDTLDRVSNIVTAHTDTPHGLKPGYLALLSGFTPSTLGSAISSIVINNEDFPGVATVKTVTPCNLIVGMSINLFDVPNDEIGGGGRGSITSISRQGGVVTVVTSNPHDLSAGAFITVDMHTTVGFAGTLNGSFIVTQIVNPTTFVYLQADTDGSVAGVGTISLNWPFPTTVAPTVFEIVAVLDASTFQIAISYSNGIWTSSPAQGLISQTWDGTFFVRSVIDPLTFTYFQIGPDFSTGSHGMVTPTGQASAGQHQMQVVFVTRQGYTTRPSPPVSFVANGGQYLTVSNIPIGPPNVQARILAFTGAFGASFFYIPVPAMVNGQQVSTATQIDDNTTTSVVLDFSDNTLFAALGINILGNNLPAQIIVEGALGFGHFGSRLITYGQRNIIQNLLNMGFDGGYFPTDPTFPTGWIADGSPATPGGVLAAGHFGQAWQITGAGSIHQSFYLDAYGAPIATPRQKYTLRAWIKGTGTITLTISAASTGFSSSVTLTGTSVNGSWIEGAFNTQMPDMIPVDMILTLSGTVAAIVDEISIIYADNPYLDRILYGSYVNNPEGIDGLTGKFGPANDVRKVMTFGMIRGTLFLLTRDPTGRLHAIIDNGVTEPAGWTINEVGTNCGCVSAFGLTVSQADDASGGGGEEWISWAAYGGARIFGGDQPWKISQEIQPDWDNVNPAAVLRIWAANDPVKRVIYFGLPVGTATAPNLIYPVDYKDMDSAYQIATEKPAYRAFDGKMKSGEFARKWTRWNLTINGAALMYRQATGQLFMTFLDGNGLDPANPGSPVVGGCGNVFILCPNKLTDDCFGQIHPYYVTYFFPSHLLEGALQLGSQRKMLEFFQYLATGTGVMRVSFLCNALDNVWPLNCIRDLSPDPQFDIEHPGASATGQRIAFKFEGLPAGSV